MQTISDLPKTIADPSFGSGELLAALRRLEKEPLVTISIAGYRKSIGPKLELLVWEKASGLSNACGVKYRKVIEDEGDPAAEIIAAANFLANVQAESRRDQRT